MTNYEHLQENPEECRRQLVCMNIVSTEFQRRAKHPRQDDRKEQSKKRTFVDRIQLKAGSEEKMFSGNKRDCILQHRIDSRKKESRCFKYRRKNHHASDCEYCYVSQTPPLKYASNRNQENVNQKVRTDKGHLRITELGSEEDSGTE